LGIKVTPAGRKIWVLQAIYPGAKVQTRRTLGTYPALGVEAAREMAVRWRSWVKAGVDPTVAEAGAAATERAKRETDSAAAANTFAKICERYFREHLNGQRRAGPSEREIRRTLVKEWGPRPITQVTPNDVKALINRLKVSTPYEAKNAFGHARTFFKWCVHDGLLEASPCASLAKKWLFSGVKVGPRQRALNDEELRAFWTATGVGLAGKFYRLLLLTSVRVNELRQGVWSELHPELRRVIYEANGRPVDWAKVDPAVKRWVIPRTRVKSDADRLVCLSDAACQLFSELPRFKGCDYLFSVDGHHYRWFGADTKRELDAQMLAALRAQAAERGEDAAHLPNWVCHDLRRTVKSNLAALDVEDNISESVLGHVKKGLSKTYDTYKYEKQMRVALTRWAARIEEIVTPRPAPDNILQLRARTSQS
jgi:integrase